MKYVEHPTFITARRFHSLATVVSLPPNKDGDAPVALLEDHERAASKRMVHILTEDRREHASVSNALLDALQDGVTSVVDVRGKYLDGSYGGPLLADDTPLTWSDATALFDYHPYVLRARMTRTADKGSPVVRAYSRPFQMEHGYLIASKDVSKHQEASEERVISSLQQGDYALVRRVPLRRVKGMAFYAPVLSLSDSLGVHLNGRQVHTGISGPWVMDVPVVSLQDGIGVGYLPNDAGLIPVFLNGTSRDDLGSIVNARVRWQRPTFIHAVVSSPRSS
ncbi:hypothetical protein AUJ68_05345 [Candidatus Woesearchaeota archaeon CG1_02_57_44]|nr:MAG: hypothetical protein AUJ68_05345 [Candidatus Woesearchaeota archaeon CG1_02_57_44]